MALKSKDLGLLILLRNKWDYADKVCIETTMPSLTLSATLSII